MAGRQRRNEMIHKLERRLAEWSETQEEGGVYTVFDYVCSWIASGHTLTKLADCISKEMSWDISRDMLTRYISSGVPDAARRLERARLEGAHGMNDQAIKIIDEASTATKEHLVKAKQQADVRLWTAERWNRREMGKAPDVQITVNNNTLHLDAMRMRQLQRSNQQERVLDQPAPHARLISADQSVSNADVIADVISIEHEPS